MNFDCDTCGTKNGIFIQKSIKNDNFVGQTKINMHLTNIPSELTVHIFVKKVAFD